MKGFYAGYRFHEAIFLSLIISLATSVVIIATILQFGYTYALKHISNELYLALFPIIFLLIFSFVNVFKPKVHLSNHERLFLVLGLAFSFTVIYVVL